MPITRARAEFIARAQACPKCREYTWRKLKVKAAPDAERAAGAAWVAELVCGVCGAHVHVGIEADGDVGFVG
jgi:hypothetical protein